MAKTAQPNYIQSMLFAISFIVMTLRLAFLATLRTFSWPNKLSRFYGIMNSIPSRNAMTISFAPSIPFGLNRFIVSLNLCAIFSIILHVCLSATIPMRTCPFSMISKQLLLILTKSLSIIGAKPLTILSVVFSGIFTHVFFSSRWACHELMLSQT